MTGITRRSALKALGTAAVAMGAGLESAFAQARKFTWASTGGTWGETVKRVFVDPFAAAQKIETAHSAQLESVAAAKILASCGNAPYDVTNGAPGDHVLMEEAKCLEPYDPSIVTNLGDIYDEGKEGNYYAAFNILLFGLTWNTKESSKPASFNDLARPAYKGRVGIPAYGWYGMVWLHAYNKVLGGTEDNITPGITAVADLVKKNKAIIVENADHGTRLMESAEIVMMPYWNGRTVRLQEAKVPAMFEIVPGSISVGSGFSVAKGTPFSKPAQQFVKITLEPERQLEFTRWSKYPPANKKVKLPPDLQMIEIPPGALEKTAKLDWRKINQHRSAYLERWNKEVLGS